MIVCLSWDFTVNCKSPFHSKWLLENSKLLSYHENIVRELEQFLKHLIKSHISSFSFTFQSNGLSFTSQKLMTKVGVEDFSLRDVLKPESPRVRRIFSAVINFAKFREERTGVFELCNQKSVRTMNFEPGILNLGFKFELNIDGSFIGYSIKR